MILTWAVTFGLLFKKQRIENNAFFVLTLIHSLKIPKKSRLFCRTRKACQETQNANGFESERKNDKQGRNIQPCFRRNIKKKENTSFSFTLQLQNLFGWPQAHETMFPHFADAPVHPERQHRLYDDQRGSGFRQHK